MVSPVYLDDHATTRVDERVLAEMLPYFQEHFGNAASRSHAHGWTAEAAVDLARERVAQLLGAQSNEIVFTSGATEANNLALLGAFRAARGSMCHVVTIATEHAAVLDPCAQIAREGGDVTVLEVDAEGLVSPAAVAAAVRADTLLVSVMAVNNEIGVVQPVAEIAAAVKAEQPRCLLHCDAAQAGARLTLSPAAWQLDLLSLSAHKMYGPKGVGALWVRRRPRVPLQPILHGGGHEGGLRSGTLPVPLVAGFGLACELARTEGPLESGRVRERRDQLLEGLRARCGPLRVHGSLEQRVAGNLNVSFEGVEAEALITATPGLSFSTGSACASSDGRPSHVIAALGVADEERRGAVRFGLGRFTTAADIARAIEILSESIAALRAASPAWKAAPR